MKLVTFILLAAARNAPPPSPFFSTIIALTGFIIQKLFAEAHPFPCLCSTQSDHMTSRCGSCGWYPLVMVAVFGCRLDAGSDLFQGPNGVCPRFRKPAGGEESCKDTQTRKDQKGGGLRKDRACWGITEEVGVSKPIDNGNTPVNQEKGEEEQ